VSTLKMTKGDLEGMLLVLVYICRANIKAISLLHEVHKAEIIFGLRSS